MKRWLVMLLTVVGLSGCSQEDVVFADGSGGSWSHWHGRWVLINYWAEWCAPCRKEIPELNELHRERAETGVVVLGVNFDGLNGEKLVRLIDEMGIEFPVLAHDPRLRWELEQPSVLPATLIIDPDGALQEVLVGPQTLETLREGIARHSGAG